MKSQSILSIMLPKKHINYRHLWLPELVVLLALSTTSLILFWNTDLDIKAASWFFHAENLQQPWLEQNFYLWKFFYKAAPIISGLVGIGSLVLLCISLFKQSLAKYKLYFLFIFTSLVLGPGILVNAVFKDNWGRPRPRQIIEFGGNKKFVKVGIKNTKADGKSFPCGHSSVGFLLFVFWFIFRRKNFKLALFSFGAALSVGILMGIGRMAAGGHFLSDVVWSALMPFFASWLLYYFVFQIPKKEDLNLLNQKSDKRGLQAAIYGGLILLTALGASLATPFHKDFEHQLVRERDSKELKIEVDSADIMISVNSKSTDYFFKSTGNFRGFGLPNNRLIHHQGERDNYAYYIIKHSGLFTDKDSHLKLELYPNELKQISIYLEHGNIHLSNEAKNISTIKIHRSKK